MKKGWLLVGVMLVAAMAPFTANANVGTPMMWAGFLHLLFGNAIIGVGEGLAIAWFFHLPKRRCVLWMIAANYSSAWLRGLGLVQLIRMQLDWSLYTAWRNLWLCAAFTYLFTLLLEWPFVALCFRRQADWLKRSVKASLVVQTASYLLLFGWYWSATDASLFRETNRVPVSDFQLPANLRLFYIRASDGAVCEKVFSSGEERILQKSASTNANDVLFLRPDSVQTSTWDLLLQDRYDRYRPSGSGETTPRLILAGIRAMAAREVAREDTGEDLTVEAFKSRFSESASTFSGTTNLWLVGICEYYPGLGLGSMKRGAKEQFALYWESPFSTWEFHSAIQLPNELVLFELGGDQICVLDPESRKLGLLVRGRGPVALLK